MAHSLQIVIACDDPENLARFWAAATGYVVQPPPEGFDSWEDFATEAGIPEENWNDISACVDPEGIGPRLLFERYDGGPPNRRVHVDINVMAGNTRFTDDRRKEKLAQERKRLEALGATFKRDAVGATGEVFMEMYDPEGNWFCVQ